MEESDAPKVKPGEWITIGEGPSILRPFTLHAVVTDVYDSLSADGGAVSVIYDDLGRIIYRDAKWTGTSWDFARPDPDGVYADKITRLALYVNILRRGPET